MRKRKQFTRVDRVLETMLDTTICSEGYLYGDHNIVKWGFYPRPYMEKQVILFDTRTGKYEVGMEIGRTVSTYHEYEGYSIKDLKRMIAEIYPNLV